MRSLGNIGKENTSKNDVKQGRNKKIYKNARFFSKNE